MVLALVGAVLSALCYGGATVLQAVGARRTATAETVDPRVLLRVLRQVPYLAGIGLDLLGFLFSLAALRELPLFVVEPVVAGSVAVTAVLAVPLLGARLAGREWAAVAAVVVGLALLGASGEPSPAEPAATALRWVLVAAALGAPVLGALLARRDRRWVPAALGALAGWEFGVVGVAARILRDPTSVTGLLGDPATWALALAGVAALALLTVAVQRGSVTAATAAMVVVETAAPAAVGIALLGDSTRAGFGPLAVAGFAVALLAAVALSRFGELETVDTGGPAAATA